MKIKQRFSQNFGQLGAQIMLYLIEMVKVSFIVAWSIVFIFIKDRYREVGTPKFKKSCHFKLFLAAVVHFPKILSRSVCNFHNIFTKQLYLYFKVRAQLFTYLYDLRQHGLRLILGKSVVFKYFQLVWSLHQVFLAGVCVAYTRIARNSNKIIC